MGTPHRSPVSAKQVGSYFLAQYYQSLHQKPEFVHKFYTDASKMIRVDGNKREFASGTKQIHELLMSLKFTGIVVKTAFCLNSWDGGFFIMVVGEVKIKDFIKQRNYVQTFFLAPQEYCYFVYNDIFYFIDEAVTNYPETVQARAHFNSSRKASILPLESAEKESEALSTPEHTVENDMDFTNHIPEKEFLTDNTLIEVLSDYHTASFPDSANPLKEQLLPINKPVVGCGQPSKPPYASALQTIRRLPEKSSQASSNKRTQLASAVYTLPQPSLQKCGSVSSIMTSSSTGGEGAVYVQNLPLSTSISDIEKEFMSFGRIIADGIVLGKEKDFSTCYAFVEFETAVQAQNAVKASPIQFNGHQVYVEEA